MIRGILISIFLCCHLRGATQCALYNKIFSDSVSNIDYHRTREVNAVFENWESKCDSSEPLNRGLILLSISIKDSIRFKSLTETYFNSYISNYYERLHFWEYRKRKPKRRYKRFWKNFFNVPFYEEFDRSIQMWSNDLLHRGTITKEMNALLKLFNGEQLEFFSTIKTLDENNWLRILHEDYKKKAKKN